MTNNSDEQNSLVPIESNLTETAIEPEIESAQVTFGKYSKKSRICTVCMRRDHMEINRMRAQDHMTYDDIVRLKGISRDALDVHFRKHFYISKHNQDILDLKEDSSQEANDIITRALEGDVDLFGGGLSVIESKAQRLSDIKNRLRYLSDRAELNTLDDVEKQEYIALNKLAEDIENSIVKVQQIIHKKIFPSSKEELAKAVMSYKLSVLSKFVDDIVLVLIELEKNPDYKEVVHQIRLSLSQRVSFLEAKVLKSGGVIQSLDDEQNDT